MAEEELLRQAVDTAWSVYRATHNVDEADERRCLLERYIRPTEVEGRESVIAKS